MRRLALILTLLMLPAVAAACGGDDAGEAVDAGDDAQTIEVSASDFEFDPPELTADAGDVTFELTNDGGAPHALAIRGHGMDESSDVIDGGDSTSFTVTLEDGEYEIYCPVGDHEDRGMVGTLTVGSGGDGGATTHEDTTTDDGETSEDETETEGGETETDDSSGSGSDDATNY